MTFYPYSPVYKLRAARYYPIALIFATIFTTIFVTFNIIFIKSPEKDKGIYDPTLTPEQKIRLYEYVIEELYRREQKLEEKSKLTSIYYEKRPETQHIDCGRVLRGDKKYTASISGPNRVPIIENPSLNMSCPAIISRINRYPHLLKPLKFGVAFARIVYDDYEFIEKQVQTSFHPQNVFCFVVDAKSDVIFQQRIWKMSECFPNVFMLPVLENYDSSGHNMNLGHHRCMEAVISVPGWNYLMLLQNDDVIIKSVYELERIYELLDGANDIDIQPESGRLVKSFKWDPRSLKLFRNETGINPEILDTPMEMAKGDTEGSLSRAAVEWMVRTVDVSIFIDQWNRSGYGCDEQFISSFQINEAYGMPGHFTDECLKKGMSTQHVSKLTEWTLGSTERCASKIARHSVCLMGIEDLRTLAVYPNLMVNKMMPHFDYSIVDCTAELLHNRTFLGQKDHPINEFYYKNMVNVLYHKNHLKPDFQLNCTFDYIPWRDLPYPV